MSYDVWERMRRESWRQASLSSDPRQGVISGYDPDRYAVKVRIMPEAAFPELPSGSGETGWIPLGTQWSGDQWGDFSPPNIGDQVHVNHQEADSGTGIVSHRIHDAQHRPLPVPSGERWIVHKSNSYMRLMNDQTVSVNGKAQLGLSVGGSPTDASVPLQTQILMGPDQVTLSINPSGAVVTLLADRVLVGFGSGVLLTITATSVRSSVHIIAPAFTVG